MLQFRSFDISKGEDISKFLREQTLAKDATILITNGFVGIPFEDGEPVTTKQQIVRLKETKNGDREKVNYLTHNKRELEVTIHGINKEIEKAKEVIAGIKDAKKDRELKRETEKDIQRFENMIKNHTNSVQNTMAEITRLEVGIAVYDEEVHELEEGLKKD